MVWVSSDLYSSSVFRLLTWYRPVSARSEQCGTEADMRAGAAHKRDVLPHSISGLRSIRWLAPWAPARAVVIGWAQRLGARWHSGRQLLGTEAEQNEYNRNINLGACGSSATERISASTAAVWTRVSPLASPYRSVLLAYGPPSQLLPPLPALGLLQRQLPQRSRTECGPCLSPPLLPTSPLDTTGAVRDEHATIDTPSLPCVAITTSWGSVGHLFDVAMPLYLIAVSSSSRLLALARPAVERLWQEVQCASTSVSAVWTPVSEPAISDAFAIDAPVLGTSVPEVFDALDTTLLKIVDEYSTPTGDDFLLWHARLGHFSRDRVVGALRYKGYAFRPGSDRCICDACLLNRRRKGHPSHPTNRRVYTYFGERVASDLNGPIKLLPWSVHKFVYAINFVDYFSGVIAVYFLEKGDSAEILGAIRAFLRDHAHLLTKTRRPGIIDEWLTDNASYFTSELIDELCTVLAIQHFFSSPDIHEGNAVAERCWGTLLKCTRTALVHAGGDKEYVQFWPFLFNQFARVHNLLQTNKGTSAEPRWLSPMQIAIGYPREYSLERFKVMLCDCTCVLPESLRGHNLTPARLKGINLGHDPRRSKYLVYIPAVRRIIYTADVSFDELSFTVLGGPWRNINVRGIEDRPHVPDALINVNAARPPNGPVAAQQWGAPAAAPAAPAQAAAPRRSARIAARGAP